MRLFNRVFLTPALVTLAAAPLAAQVKLHLEPATLLPGQSAELHACLDGSWWQPDWNWSLPDPDNGRVERGTDGRWRYVAAGDFLVAPRRVRIQVAPADGSHPPQDATLTVCARPPLDAATPCVLEALAPGLVGRTGSGRTGAWLGEGWVRGYRVGPGANLANAQLAGANLSGYNLTGADFRAADCSGATFAGSILKGANFKGARVYEANFRDAVGLDRAMAGAEPHPFFPATPDPVGTVRFLAPEAVDGPLDRPRCLARAPDGTLFWLQGRRIQTLRKCGLRTHLAGHLDQEMLGLVADPKGMLWFIGEKTSGCFDLKHDLEKMHATGHGRVLHEKSHFSRIPTGLAPCARGGAWVTWPEQAWWFSRKGDELSIHSSSVPTGLRGLPDLCSVPSRDGSTLVGFSPGAPFTLFDKFQGGVFKQPWEKGERIQGAAQGPGDEMWLAGANPDALYRFDLKHWRRTGTVTLEPRPDGPRNLSAIVLGPDDNLWLAEPGGFGRVTPKGEYRFFPLPQGGRPAELLAADDGRIYFTLEGQPFIGALSVVEPPAPGESKTSPAEWAGPLYTPRPVVRRTLTRAQRYERARLAEERWLARTGEAADADGADEPVEAAGTDQVPSSPEESKSASAQAEAEAARGPAVNLTRGAIRHILRRHGRHSSPVNSLFAERFCSPGALRGLLSEALAGAPAFGAIVSRNGNHLTFCQVPEVGRTGLVKGGKATGRLLVVTAPHFNGEDYEHDLVSAFPVP